MEPSEWTQCDRATGEAVFGFKGLICYFNCLLRTIVLNHRMTCVCCFLTVNKLLKHFIRQVLSVLILAVLLKG